MPMAAPARTPRRVAAWRRCLPLQWLASVVFTAQLFLLSPVWGAVITLLGWLPFRALYHFARGWAGSRPRRVGRQPHAASR